MSPFLPALVTESQFAAFLRRYFHFRCVFLLWSRVNRETLFLVLQALLDRDVRRSVRDRADVIRDVAADAVVALEQDPSELLAEIGNNIDSDRVLRYLVAKAKNSVPNVGRTDRRHASRHAPSDALFTRSADDPSVPDQVAEDELIALGFRPKAAALLAKHQVTYWEVRGRN